MRILLVSDLHIKQSQSSVEGLVSSIPRDLLIVLGDFGKSYNIEKFTGFIKYHLQFSDIIFVLGNHEYFAPSFSEVSTIYRTLFSNINDNSSNTVHLLQNDSLMCDGIRFIGTVLWSNPDLGIPEVVEGITLRATMYGLSVYDFIALHHTHVRYLEQQLSIDTPTVVLTHHAPSMRSIAPQFIQSSTNSIYATNLEHLMHAHTAPAYWFHGHIHIHQQYQCGNTTVISNPRGYNTIEQRTGYHTDFIVNIF